MACANSRFDICMDTLEAPDGKHIDDFLIVRPKVRTEDGVVGILVLPEVDGKIGLMRGHRHQMDEVVWQAPAGFVENSETADFAASRELLEETGLSCPPEELVSLGTMLPDAGLVEGRVALFLARASAQDTNAVNDIEPGAGEITWFSTTELHYLLTHESNIGGSTLVAGFRYLATTGCLAAPHATLR